MASSVLVTLAVLVGALIPLQSGINAALGRSLGHPLLAALTNFAVGGIALALGAAVLQVPLPNGRDIASAPPWAWWGGLCGACLVVVAVLAAPRLGAALLVACLIAGQLSSSVLLDHMGWVGFIQRPVSTLRMLGLVLLGAGVLCIRKG